MDTSVMDEHTVDVKFTADKESAAQFAVQM